MFFVDNSTRGVTAKLSSFTTRVATVGTIMGDTRRSYDEEVVTLVSRPTHDAGPVRNATLMRTLVRMLGGYGNVGLTVAARCGVSSQRYLHCGIRKLRGKGVGCQLNVTTSKRVPRRTVNITRSLGVSPS